MALREYDFGEILDAIKRADYEFVLNNAMPHALVGNSDAQSTIALVYENCWGVQKDVLEAERWLLKATAQDSPLAWHNLGTMYAMKYPILEQRWDEARRCWERAKELGFDCGYPYPLEKCG